MPEEGSLGPEQNSASSYTYSQSKSVAEAQMRSLYQLLLKIGDLVTTSRELPNLFEELAPVLQRITDCDVVVWSIHDAAHDCFARQFWKRDGQSGELKAAAASDGISAWVWTNQQVLAIPELKEEPLYLQDREELRARGVLSYAAVPMSTSLRRYGVLGFGRNQEQESNPEEQEFLSRVTRMAALALENQQTTHAWGEQQNRLQSLASIGRDIRSNLDPGELMTIVFRHLHQVTKYDYAVLSLLESEDMILRVQATDFPGCDLKISMRVPLAEATSMRAIQTRSIAYLSAEELASMRNNMAEQLLRSGIRSVCNLPLLANGRVLGALSVGSKQVDGFRLEDTAYLHEVAGHVGAALEQANAYREIAQLRDRLAQEKSCLENEIRSDRNWDDMVGTSPGLKRVLESAAVVSRTDATVLITGDTGTGKERIARVIHAMSERKDRIFIKLNCAAIPTGLLESELFGHEKGAFTGAIGQKVGRLELADKGTLFLDEIGDIPLELQPKLLRVLQDYEFERLGGTRTIRVNVRLIAATNCDLGRAVEEKQFRRDLFYRLHVFPIHLPALRERRGDIPLLVRHFVQRCGARLGKKVDIIPDQAIDVMMKWDWPGNIRELENFVERSVILSQGNILRAPLGELEAATADQSSQDDTLRSRERDHIIQVLRQTHGMLSGPSGAAARLGLKRTTLQYRMQKLGIARMEYLD